jgi:hypothetical protein
MDLTSQPTNKESTVCAALTDRLHMPRLSWRVDRPHALPESTWLNHFLLSLSYFIISSVILMNSAILSDILEIFAHSFSYSNSPLLLQYSDIPRYFIFWLI